MSETVSLPALGESVTEGTVTRWLKNVGDRVEVDEPLLEVSTDKVDTEVPSPISGVLEEILVHEDETVDVGTVLARVGDGSGATAAGVPETARVEPQTPEPAPVVPEEDEQEAPAAPPVPAASVSVPAAAPAPSTAQEPLAPATAQQAGAAEPQQPAQRAAHAGQYVTPIVRKLANERGVDLDSLTGSGVGGRIRKEDVLSAANRSAGSSVRGTRRPMSRLRKVTAENAVASLRSSAQATSVKEVDVTALAHFRAEAAAGFEKKTGTPLGFLPFVVRAAAESLRDHPDVNAVLDGDTIVYPDEENISLTIDTDKGILTPVLHRASASTVAQLAASIAQVTSRVESNTLRPDELTGGTFTITDSGSRGALFDTPVVFLPQVAALGVGEVIKRPAVVTVDGEDAIAVRSTVFLSLSYDQRVVDSAEAARFLTTVAEHLAVTPPDASAF
jgi:2-oxoglutarate dehydrogenase E2 component (dihydrolipoamide succinyltransferase)